MVRHAFAIWLAPRHYSFHLLSALRRLLFSTYPVRGKNKGQQIPPNWTELNGSNIIIPWVITVPFLRAIAHGAKLIIATVNPSICLFVTCWYSIQKNEDRIMRSSLWNSPNALVFWHQLLLGRRPLPPKMCGQSDTPRLKIADFDQYMLIK